MALMVLEKLIHPWLTCTWSRLTLQDGVQHTFSIPILDPFSDFYSSALLNVTSIK